MAEANTNTSWAGDTFGTTWMHETLIKMLRWIDVRIIYAFVAVFVVPVTLIVSPGARVYIIISAEYGNFLYLSRWGLHIAITIFSARLL